MTKAAKAAAKSVVVIGGTGGIGHAIAAFYAKRGGNVVITGRDAKRTAAVAAENQFRIKFNSPERAHGTAKMLLYKSFGVKADRPSVVAS